MTDKTTLFNKAVIDRNMRKEQLAELVAFPSLAFPGYDPKDSMDCANLVADMLREVGFKDIEFIDVGGQNPTVWAETKYSDDVPTLLLYAHYDVQPAPMEQGWNTDPWTMVEKDGRYFGRGTADDKAGIVQHLSALRILCAQLHEEGAIKNACVNELPFNIKVCFEGEEEYGDSLPRYIPADPDRFVADAFLVCDGGNLERGKPVMQTRLRGIVELTFTLKTLPNALHSGAFGGPAPDAYLALTRLIASMYDKDGNTVIDGVNSSEYKGSVDYSDELFRRQAEVPAGIDLVGTDSIAARLWTKPALTVVGVDMPSVEASSNIVIPEVSARLSLRIPAGQDGREVMAALKAHIEAHTPWGAEITYTEENYMDAFCTGGASGPYTKLMEQCLTEAFDYPCGEAGTGGSIPLVGVLAENSPDAEVLLFGPIDSELSNIHGANESVCISELENCTKAEALFMSRLI